MRKLTDQEDIELATAFAVARSRQVNKFKSQYNWFSAGFVAALEYLERGGFEVGDKVALKHNPKLGTATIDAFLTDVKGGVILSKKLDEFGMWNVEELLKVE